MNKVSYKLVFDRKHIATKTHEAPVQLEITLNRKRRYFSTGVRLLAGQWSKDCVVKGRKDAVALNHKLAVFMQTMSELVFQCDSKRELLTFEKIESVLEFKTTSDSPECTFLDFMQNRIVHRQVVSATKERHYCILRALKKFGKIKRFEDINTANIMEWDRYAHTKCKLPSSIYNYHKILKIYIREAVALQHIARNPYDTIRIARKSPSNIKYLTKAELAKLENKEITNESLCRVRDTFLFCCYTGLSYSDLVAFDFSKAEEIDGMYRIKGNRKKTGVEYNIALIDKAMNILRKYNYHLPVISNQKYNAYLKVLGAFCEIRKPITSHVARHTFATTITLANGVRMEVVSKMLGHSNINTTQLYAKICQPEIDSEFNRLNQLLR